MSSLYQNTKRNFPPCLIRVCALCPVVLLSVGWSVRSPSWRLEWYFLQSQQCYHFPHAPSFLPTNCQERKHSTTFKSSKCYRSGVLMGRDYDWNGLKKNAGGPFQRWSWVPCNWKITLGNAVKKTALKIIETLLDECSLTQRVNFIVRRL